MAGVTPSLTDLTPSNDQDASRPQPRASFLRSSSKLRIEAILDTARQRSVQLAGAGAGIDEEEMPRPRKKPLPTSEHDGGATESSADEQTAIVKRQDPNLKDYQGTSAAHGNEIASVTRRPAAGKSDSTGEASSRQPVEGEAEDNDDPDDESWWKKTLHKYGSIELDNKGSTARDHLALERTFLAWLRTSLAFASIGIAITQLFRLNTTVSSGNGADPYARLRQMGKPLGATFLGVSVLVLGIGFQRYFEGQHWIIKGKFPASRASIAVIAVFTAALMVTSLVIVVVVEPSQFEK